MTRAPAAAARAPVSSIDPSSMTSTSPQVAEASRRCTTPPIASASFIAGMTIETTRGSANQLLHDAVPGDLSRPGTAGLAKRARPIAIRCQRHDRLAEWLRLRSADEAVRAVDDEFECAAGIGSGNHRLA